VSILHHAGCRRLGGIRHDLSPTIPSRPDLPKPPASRDAILYEIAVAWFRGRDEHLLAKKGDDECRVAILLPDCGE
jgi:hypothetical protein